MWKDAILYQDWTRLKILILSRCKICDVEINNLLQV